MDFIEALLHTRSCSVVGLEKNTGKTVCLNYILRHLPLTARVAVTSIGIDGESKDQVTGTKKPEITLRKGMVFATSEKHYRMRHLVSEILDVSNERTALGQLVTGRVLTEGKVMLSGPGSTASIRRWMKEAEPYADLVIVDGALSRMSLASPAVSESMVLATGAAYSANIDTLVKKTAYVVELINLPKADEEEEGAEERISMDGAVTDRVLEGIMNKAENNGKELVIQDFTKVFADPMVWHRFTKSHHVYVRQRSKLLAVTVNPTAPNGMVLDSDKLCERLSEAINLPVYDLMKQ
ncbi:MAG: hypothetical protein II970_06780 [Paludibacteraceae bacterium]|nr:hypothetical protein [Paludibacteraceae bacterium]